MTSASSGSQATLDPDLTVEAAQVPSAPWVTIVFNDPVNLMSYVTYVFRSYFGYSRERAEKLMREVHEAGRSTVARGSREEMERDTQSMHGFGLWASCQPADGGGA